MKCPECEKSQGVDHLDLRGGMDFAEYCCDMCGAEWEFHHLIDPTELKSLIEKVITPGDDAPLWRLIYAIQSYLDGAPTLLTQLAGEEK